MKKTSFLLLPLIAIYALLAFRTEKPVLLRLNLQEGATYLYNTTYNQNIMTHVAGQTVTAKMNMESEMNLKVTQKYKADSTLIQARYNYMALHIDAKGTETTIDSRDTASTNSDQLVQLVNAMQNNPITIKTNSLGEVLDIRGLDKISQSAGTSQNPALKNIMDKFLNENTFKHSFTNLGIFPEKAVSVGDHWDRDITMDNMITMNIHSTYTVKDIQQGKVILDVSSDISSPKDSATFNGFTIPVQVSGTQSGVYTIERSSGLISSGNTNQKMSMQMSMMGQDMTIAINGKFDVTERPVK